MDATAGRTIQPPILIKPAQMGLPLLEAVL